MTMVLVQVVMATEMVLTMHATFAIRMLVLLIPLVKIAAIRGIPVSRKLLFKTAALRTSAPLRLVPRPRTSKATPPLSTPPTAMTTRVGTFMFPTIPTTTRNTIIMSMSMSMRTALVAQNIITISSG